LNEIISWTDDCCSYYCGPEDSEVIDVSRSDSDPELDESLESNESPGDSDGLSREEVDVSEDESKLVSESTPLLSHVTSFKAWPM
jgi:hypothetical protein